MRSYLIVDDNREMAENVAEILELEGAKAVVTTSGLEAMEQVRTNRFDALVTDMRMPVMQGAEVVHSLRTIDPGLPAVVMTAYTGDNDLEAARQEGLLGILPKPVPLPRLLELLGRAKRNGLVALVEDDLALRDNLTEALREAGFGTVSAGSVSETERLGGVRPFAALVDIRVPGGPDGEALRKLIARFPKLPILVTTAFAEKMPEVEHRGLFAKPFDTAELLRELERIHDELPGAST
jgi:CheY-like chemotaxis protein